MAALTRRSLLSGALATLTGILAATRTGKTITAHRPGTVPLRGETATLFILDDVAPVGHGSPPFDAWGNKGPGPVYFDRGFAVPLPAARHTDHPYLLYPADMAGPDAPPRMTDVRLIQLEWQLRLPGELWQTVRYVDTVDGYHRYEPLQSFSYTSR